MATATATKRTRLRKTEVVFQRTDGKWILSTPTQSGFLHREVGGPRHTRREAVRRALEVLSS